MKRRNSTSIIHLDGHPTSHRGRRGNYTSSSDANAAIARALAAAVPHVHVLLFPENDALPGHDLPASPVNIGSRMAVLAILKALAQQSQRAPVALIVAAGALAWACPAPSEIEVEFLSVATGAAVDLPQLLGTITALGYVEDSRVDEPGEVALRGQVLDVFPAQSGRPVRVEAENGKVTRIRIYDLLDQRTIGETDAFAIVPIIEPSLGRGRCSLLDHLPGARVVLDERAEGRRQRVLKLAGEIDEGSAVVLARLLPQEAWKKAIADRHRLTLERWGEPPPRFIESR